MSKKVSEMLAPPAPRTAAPQVQREPVAQSVPPACDVDAAKDKALLDVFSQVIAARMQPPTG